MKSTPETVTKIKRTISFDKNLYKQLEELSNTTMIPRSRLITRGIELVLNEYKKVPHK